MMDWIETVICIKFFSRHGIATLFSQRITYLAILSLFERQKLVVLLPIINYCQLIMFTSPYLQVIYETLSPTWNQMLVIDDITLPFPGFYMKSNPPVITIELFDQDSIVCIKLVCCVSVFERCFSSASIFRFSQLSWRVCVYISMALEINCK